MAGKLARSISAAAAVAALTYGIARSATSRYQERRQAILAAAKVERERLGLADRKALFARYPTPEIKLCRSVAVLPGATAEVVVQGKFAPGTRFLFENDNLEVIKENTTATEYRATVAAARNSGPSYANAYAFAPVSAGQARCLAVLIGGKYEWEFSAENGWRVRLKPVRQNPGREPGRLPEQVYQAEFRRGAEGKAFASFNAILNIDGAASGDSYSAFLRSEALASPDMTELEKLRERMMTMDKLSPNEQEQLMKRLEQLAATMEGRAHQQIATIQQHQREMPEQDCTQIHFRLAPDGVKGHLACGSRPVNIRGSMKFLGPW